MAAGKWLNTDSKKMSSKWALFRDEINEAGRVGNQSAIVVCVVCSLAAADNRPGVEGHGEVKPTNHSMNIQTSSTFISS